jgi:hypothetical protein
MWLVLREYDVLIDGGTTHYGRAHGQGGTLSLSDGFHGSGSTTAGTQLASSLLCFECSQASLNILLTLELSLLGGWRVWVARSRVARDGATLCLPLPELRRDALIMLLADIVRNTFHAKDLDVHALAVGERIEDLGEGFLVNLLEMDGEA